MTTHHIITAISSAGKLHYWGEARIWWPMGCLEEEDNKPKLYSVGAFANRAASHMTRLARQDHRIYKHFKLFKARKLGSND